MFDSINIDRKLKSLFCSIMSDILALGVFLKGVVCTTKKAKLEIQWREDAISTLFCILPSVFNSDFAIQILTLNQNYLKLQLIKITRS